MNTVIITSEQNKTYCQNLINELPDDGSYTIEIKKTKKDSTSKQRRLQWLWYTELSQSGLGRNDTKEGCHLTAKWQFCRPILLRDCETFPIFFNPFMKVTQYAEGKSNLTKLFTRDYISTEILSRVQRAEYLTNFQDYWTRKGVNLANPELQGLDPDKLF